MPKLYVRLFFSIILLGAVLCLAPVRAEKTDLIAHLNIPATFHPAPAPYEPKLVPALYKESDFPSEQLKEVSPLLVSTDQITGYKEILPKSMADSTDFPEQYRSAVEINAKDDFEREQGYHLAKIIRGNPHGKEIALTFDDGPHAKYTLQLLTELKALHVPATFFVVGKQAVKFPTLVQLEVIEGDEVGNHTYDHVNLTKIPPALVPYELDECDAVLRHILGTSPRFFRPPGGDYNQDVIRSAASHGYITTLWTDDPGDYAHLPSDLILQRCMSRLTPGAIILLHDGIPQTMEMLPQLVQEAKEKGYTFVTMSKLASGRDVDQ